MNYERDWSAYVDSRFAAQRAERHKQLTKPPCMIAPDPPRGIIAEVSRRLGLSHEHVAQVAFGNRTSTRVLRALRQEVARRGVPSWLVDRIATGRA